MAKGTGDGVTSLDLPYTKPTPQVQGRIEEKKISRRLGARLHPNSGAGKIKDDSSTGDTVYEIKNANRSFTLNSSDLYATFARAVRQGKEGIWVIQFANGITAEIHLIGRRAQI